MANEAEPQQKIIITDSLKMYEDMSPYYLRETFSDIQLILSDKIIHAHKIVLAARCKYFESLLMIDPKQAEIALQNVPSKAFETILYYIYTGSIVIASEDENNISDILKLAHEYSLKTLEKSINEKMNSIVNLSNVCSLLNKANAHDMDELREICHTFIDKHVSQKLEYDFFNILTQKSMINLLKRDAFPVEEINVFKIAANWCKFHEDLDNLVIECIRFSTLTRNEILTVVWTTKIVDETKLLNALAMIEVNGPKETQRRFAGWWKGKNLATAENNVKVIFGLNTAMLFEETEKFEEGAYHNVDDKNGITVDLGAVKCFNYITMYVIIKRSWPYYYIEVSTDLQKWHNVVDYSKYYCECIQNLYFEEQQARYIRIVLKNDRTRISRFQVYMSSKVPKIHNQIVFPFSNVITSETCINFLGIETSDDWSRWERVCGRLEVCNQLYIHNAATGLAVTTRKPKEETPRWKRKTDSLLLRPLTGCRRPLLLRPLTGCRRPLLLRPLTVCRRPLLFKTSTWTYTYNLGPCYHFCSWYCK
ncbi:BTB/POZ domain-containing protein 9-like isoform X2 [Zophobas morio]|uniref:BTB/POZ domain-containing protein 9-like isoform X2 n=1 Tax=Zophobas morio TaxID=2755281 RepID=UPI003082EE74